jgi:hypothetical protein
MFIILVQNDHDHSYSVGDPGEALAGPNMNYEYIHQPLQDYDKKQVIRFDQLFWMMNYIHQVEY